MIVLVFWRGFILVLLDWLADFMLDGDFMLALGGFLLLGFW